MQSCELVTFVSSLSCCIAKGKSVDELSLLSAILVLLGDNLAAIAAQQGFCESLEERKEKCESGQAAEGGERVILR